MDQIPKRTKLAGVYRKILDKYEGKLVFPFSNPSYYQVIGLILSISFLFISSTLVKVMVVTFILILDWYDGAAARKFGLVGRRGWMIDVAVDRVSEGLIFISELTNPFGKILFFLYLVNIALSFYSVKSGKHFILALRFFYLILLIFKLW